MVSQFFRPVIVIVAPLMFPRVTVLPWKRALPVTTNVPEERRAFLAKTVEPETVVNRTRDPVTVALSARELPLSVSPCPAVTVVPGVPQETTPLLSVTSIAQFLLPFRVALPETKRELPESVPRIFALPSTTRVPEERREFLAKMVEPETVVKRRREPEMVELRLRTPLALVRPCPAPRT